MKLLRCAKCGYVLSTEEGYVQNILDEVEVLWKAAEKEKNGRKYNLYSQKAAQMGKIARLILHYMSTQNERARVSETERGVIVRYLLEEKLITPEKLDELYAEAAKIVDERNQQDRAKIEELYGESRNIVAGMNLSSVERKVMKRVGRKKP